MRSRGTLQIRTAEGRCIPATVLDVSPGGMCLEAMEALALGAPVGIEVHGLGARGVVRYCALKHDRYQVGVALLPPETKARPSC